MRDFLLEIICLIICGASLALRKNFVDPYDIEIFMMVVNGLAFWISILLVLDKAKFCYRNRLEDDGREYKSSKSYKRLVRISILILAIMIPLDVWFVGIIRLNGDYITIGTLGIALADDFLAEFFCGFFKYK